jgi:hypothetical protein
VSEVVSSQDGVDAHAGDYATVQGVYEQQDVRMMQANPATLYAGHAAVVLADGVCVFLEAPGDEAAIRDEDEIARLEHRTVRATGLLLEGNPSDGAAIDAPCLVDLGSVELIDG